MLRTLVGILIGALIVALIAAAVGYRWYGQQHAIQEDQAKRIGELSDQVSKLASENEQLKTALAKVQDEQSRLVRENDALQKAIEQAKLTGKVPSGPLPLPYPPK